MINVVQGDLDRSAEDAASCHEAPTRGKSTKTAPISKVWWLQNRRLIQGSRGSPFVPRLHGHNHRANRWSLQSVSERASAPAHRSHCLVAARREFALGHQSWEEANHDIRHGQQTTSVGSGIGTVPSPEHQASKLPRHRRTTAVTSRPRPRSRYRKGGA